MDSYRQRNEIRRETLKPAAIARIEDSNGQLHTANVVLFLQIELAPRLGIQPLTVDVACAGAIL